MTDLPVPNDDLEEEASFDEDNLEEIEVEDIPVDEINKDVEGFEGYPEA